jgi:hypothetical protein
MATPIWFDPTSIVHSLARVEIRVANIQNAIDALMHLLRNRPEAQASTRTTKKQR